MHDSRALLRKRRIKALKATLAPVEFPKRSSHCYILQDPDEKYFDR
jgi:hypothetical protein